MFEQDEIIRIYLQVANELCDGKEWCLFGVSEPLQRFAALVAEATKEKIIETVKNIDETHATRMNVIAAIRSME